MRRTFAALFALATGGFVLAPATAWPSCPSASESPSSEDVARSVGFVAAIDGDTEQIEILRHGTAVPCLIVGMLLLPGDEVIVKGNSGSIVLQTQFLAQPISLPEDGRSFSVADSTPSSTVAALIRRIPDFVRNYFAPDDIFMVVETRPRDIDLTAAQLGYDPVLPQGEQRLSPSVDRLEVHWRGKAQHLQLVFEGRPERTVSAPGNSALIALDPEDRERLRTIRIVGDEADSIEWPVRAVDAVPLAPALRDVKDGGDVGELLEALWLLGLNESSSDGALRGDEAWRLEGLSRLAALSERMFAAKGLLSAIRAHAMPAR